MNITNGSILMHFTDDNSAILEHARSVGKCSTCTNVASDAIKSGYRITIKGEVKDLGGGDVPPSISISSIGDYENYETICDRSGVVTFPSEEPSITPTITKDGDVDLVGDTSSMPPSLAPSISSKREDSSSVEPSGIDASPSEGPSPNPTVKEDGSNNNDINLVDTSSMPPSLAPSISSENYEPSSHTSLEDSDGNRIVSASMTSGIGPLGLGGLLVIPVIVAII